MLRLLKREELVRLSPEALREHIIELGLLKKEVSDRMELLGSSLGKHQRDRWQQKLDNTLNSYGKIVTSGKTDREMVLALIELKVAEKACRAELDHLKSAVQEKERLDIYHELCEDVNRSKDKRLSSRR